MRDIDIKSFLNETPNWEDANGNSLLHYAAELGDKLLVNECLKKGVAAISFNKDNETAEDTARFWGYNEIADNINNHIKKEISQKIAKPLKYKSLEDIRKKAAKTKTNIFYVLASKGLFYMVIELAEKNKEVFTIEDFISKGKDGDSVIIKICQKGQLAEIMKPAIWMNNTTEINTIFKTLPKLYRESVDFNYFLSKIRQIKVKSRKSKPVWKQNKR